MTIENIPRILIAADRSSSGKTTLTMGILAALKSKGYTVQPFKAALDYIDPEYHTEISGRRSRNLDGYLMEKDGVLDVFAHACRSEENDKKGADIAVIEGVRGLFEGLDAFSDVGSTAQISKILKCPVIMVINARSMTRSCAALVKGFVSFDPDVTIAGVILNNVGSKRHAEKAVAAIEHYTKVPVIGIIKRDADIELSSRELGLIPVPEGRKGQRGQKEEKSDNGWMKSLEKIHQNVSEGVDLEKLVQIANTAHPLEIPAKTRFEKKERNDNAPLPKIGVAFDEAFNFYYPDNMDLLKAEGCEIVKFSPIHDSVLPNVDAVYIGGGTPEIFAKKLEDNTSMKESIKIASENGMPIFAESAGMDYLTQKMILKSKTKGDEIFEMAGIFQCNTVFGSGRRVVSYTNGIFEADTPIGKKGNTFIAHEFHHSLLEDISDDMAYAVSLTRGVGIQNQKDGIMVRNTIGTYTHFHGASYQEFAEAFVESARSYCEKRR